MQGRCVIPIHNVSGELVAYAGRAIDGSEPKYKFPIGFHKSLELYNVHRAIGESNSRRRVCVVEGFFDCLNVSAAGFAYVALMGSAMSATQEELLVRHFNVVCIMLDGDEAGQEAAGGLSSGSRPEDVDLRSGIAGREAARHANDGNHSGVAEEVGG
jgi:DNA primase